MNLRPATIDDLDLLFRWRVDDEREAGWWQGKPVTLGDHARWLQPRLRSPLVRIYIAEVNGNNVGQIRIDSNGEISFSIAKEHRGHDYGSQMLQKSISLEYCYPYFGRLKACIDRDNTLGQVSLKRAGFKLREDVLFFRWPE